MVIMKTKSKKAGSQTGSMTFETQPPISDAGTDVNVTLCFTAGTDVKHLASEIRSLSAAGSILTIAVAGPPGSGKSTFSAALATQIGPSCCVVPMDGFHLDNSVLQDRGLLARKGAPDTFDCAGFSHLVDDLKRGSGTIFPTFDRDSDSVVPAGGHVPAGTTVLLFEGNYLLFDAPVGIFVTIERYLAKGSWFDVGLYVQTIMLAARAEGLHTCPQASWIVTPGPVYRHLDIPDDQMLVVGIALGHADETAIENTLVSAREPVEDIARFHGF